MYPIITAHLTKWTNQSHPRLTPETVDGQSAGTVRARDPALSQVARALDADARSPRLGRRVRKFRCRAVGRVEHPKDAQHLGSGVLQAVPEPRREVQARAGQQLTVAAAHMSDA